MCFKIDWARLIVGSKFTIFVLFYFVFEGNFPSTSKEGQFNEGFFCVTGLGGLYLEGLIHGGAYFRNFMVLGLKSRLSFSLHKNFIVSLINGRVMGCNDNKLMQSIGF